MRRKIPLPPALLRSGQNRLALFGRRVVINNRKVGGSGDSGFSYDALALSQDAEAVATETVEANGR